MQQKQNLVNEKEENRKTQRKEVPDTEVVMDRTPTISVDLMYLHTKGVQPNLVMVDHEAGRIWGYSLNEKSIYTGNGWIQNRIARDIDNAGHKAVKIMVKSDQENSIVALQHEIQRLRDGRTIPINSPVGESESNGRVENAIRRVQDKVRTLKEHLESEAGTSIEKLDDLIP